MIQQLIAGVLMAGAGICLDKQLTWILQWGKNETDFLQGSVTALSLVSHPTLAYWTDFPLAPGWGLLQPQGA